MMDRVAHPSALWPSIALAEREQRSHAALEAEAAKLAGPVAEMVRESAAAPAPCRDLAKAALFGWERPYLR